ncbi:hypothetical protein PINS_up013791 [Pythium insidiosum]|nr:hypothetical protein PINS_up013791 [Pythium insidiosum]
MDPSMDESPGSGDTGATSVTSGSRADTGDGFAREIVLHALKTCGHLMAVTPSYCERLFLLNVPQAIENVLVATSDDDEGMIIASLVCVTLFVDWSSTRQLLFTSLRSVERLTALLAHPTISIVAMVAPLLALMAARIASLPGLCNIQGLGQICTLLSTTVEWRRSALRAGNSMSRRIAEDCCSMLLSLFSNEESVFELFNQVDAVGQIFALVQRIHELGLTQRKESDTKSHEATVEEEDRVDEAEVMAVLDLPLRVLVKISGSVFSHTRFHQILLDLCRLLGGVLLGNSQQHLVLCVLFNLFCRSDDATQLEETLRLGESTLLPQFLPLGRWVHVAAVNPASVRIVLKILHAYVTTPQYKQLLNDGASIPAVLRLVADPRSDDVAIAALQLLLAAATEREVEIAITVEDGVSILVKTLQTTSKWPVQCLLLALLRSMCHDSEIPVLILHEDGLGRFITFVRERRGVLFGADERLALSCQILRSLSSTPHAAQRFVAAKAPSRILELNVAQEAAHASEGERAMTMETLTNLARSREPAVLATLVDIKLHDHCLSLLLHSRSRSPSKAAKADSAQAKDLAPSRKRALESLSLLCEAHMHVCDGVAAMAVTTELVELLEGLLSSADDQVMVHALKLMMLISKRSTGRQAIFRHSTQGLIRRVCEIIAADAAVNARRPEELSIQLQYQVAFIPSTETRVGLKLLGYVLSDTSPERYRAMWDIDSLAGLAELIEKILGDHEHSKLQLHVLRLLIGSLIADGHAIPMSTTMLLHVCNLLLIGASITHAELAERVLVLAFEKAENDGHSLLSAGAGSQLLEQMLIVFTTQHLAPVTEATTQDDPSKAETHQSHRTLTPALTQVVNAAILNATSIHPRFIAKIVTLLSTSPLAGTRIAEVFSSDETKQALWYDEDELALASALTVYLGLPVSTSFTHIEA